MTRIFFLIKINHIQLMLYRVHNHIVSVKTLICFCLKIFFRKKSKFPGRKLSEKCWSAVVCPREFVQPHPRTFQWAARTLRCTPCVIPLRPAPGRSFIQLQFTTEKKFTNILQINVMLNWL